MDTKPDFSFPKSFRLLRSSEFREAYRKGIRMSGRYFRVFCLAREGETGSRVGFTTPRALGGGVERNRIKRRLREAVRLEIRKLERGWDIVFNPRRTVLKARFEDLQQEVQRVIRRCNGC